MMIGTIKLTSKSSKKVVISLSIPYLNNMYWQFKKSGHLIVDLVFMTFYSVRYKKGQMLELLNMSISTKKMQDKIIVLMLKRMSMMHFISLRMKQLTLKSLLHFIKKMQMSNQCIYLIKFCFLNIGCSMMET